MFSSAGKLQNYNFKFYSSFLHQVTKKLWAYLKANNLQDPENKQFFTPDETMEPVFGSEKIKCFSMSKYLKDHLTKP